MWRSRWESAHTHRSTLDETGLLLLDYPLNNSPLDFCPLVLVESFTVELEVVHLAVYLLAYVLHVYLLEDKQTLRCGDV